MATPPAQSVARHRTGRRLGLCLWHRRFRCFRHRRVRVRRLLRPQHQGEAERRVDRRHRRRNAVAGGELGLRRIARTSTQYPAIYSSFAIFLLFLIWLYLNWLILLLGASIAFYIQNPRIPGAGAGEPQSEQPHARARRAAADVSDRRELSRWRSGLDICRPDTAPRRPTYALHQRAGALERGGLLLRTGDGPARLFAQPRHRLHRH